MNAKIVITGLALASTFFLLACGSVQSAAQADCTAVGLQVGTRTLRPVLKPEFGRGKWITAISHFPQNTKYP